MAGIEPTTSRLLSECSTAKLHWQCAQEATAPAVSDAGRKILGPYSVPGLNWGPSACKADVITARPTERTGQQRRSEAKRMKMLCAPRPFTPSRTRTGNLRIRSPTRYPLRHGGSPRRAAAYTAAPVCYVVIFCCLIRDAND